MEIASSEFLFPLPFHSQHETEIAANLTDYGYTRVEDHGGCAVWANHEAPYGGRGVLDILTGKADGWNEPLPDCVGPGFALVHRCGRHYEWPQTFTVAIYDAGTDTVQSEECDSEAGWQSPSALHSIDDGELYPAQAEWLSRYCALARRFAAMLPAEEAHSG